jgi:hypothetical protein
VRQISSAALDAERKFVMTLQTMLSLNINALEPV